MALIARDSPVSLPLVPAAGVAAKRNNYPIRISPGTEGVVTMVAIALVKQTCPILL